MIVRIEVAGRVPEAAVIQIEQPPDQLRRAPAVIVLDIEYRRAPADGALGAVQDLALHALDVDLHELAGGQVEIVERDARHRLLLRVGIVGQQMRSEEHTSELQSLMRISYAVFFLHKKKKKPIIKGQPRHLTQP